MKLRGRFILPLLAASIFFAGCAMRQPPSPLPYQTTEAGTIVWQQEYEFSPPSSEWRLIPVEEDDYSFAFFRIDPGSFPSQSTFAYAEEPFGYSRDLETRREEFFRRFLWASRVSFDQPQVRPITVLGGEGLEVITEGRDPVRRHQVWTKVLFARRGERVVAFYLTQWRPMGAAYDLSAEEEFDRFVESFRFLRPSFYEELEKSAGDRPH